MSENVDVEAAQGECLPVERETYIFGGFEFFGLSFGRRLLDHPLEDPVRRGSSSLPDPGWLFGYAFIDPADWWIGGSPGIKARWDTGVPRWHPFVDHDRADAPRKYARIPLRIAFTRCDTEADAEGSRGEIETTELHLEDDLDLSYPDLQERRAAEEAARPFIVKGEDWALTLNPDALTRLHAVLETRLFDALVLAVYAGETEGGWEGRLRVEGSKIVVVRTMGLETFRGVRDALRSLRDEWETAMAWRQARLTWLPDLPKIQNWGDSELHVALTEAVPRLARRAAEQRWTDLQRREAFNGFLAKAQAFRLHHQYLRRSPDDSESSLGKDTADEDAEGYPKLVNPISLELGCRGIDPYSYQVLDGPSVELLTELAYQYDGRLPHTSALFSRRVVHALLTAETGGYLRDFCPSPVRQTRAQWLQYEYANPIGPTRREYAERPEVKEWEGWRDRDRRKTERRILMAGGLAYITGIAIGAALGGWGAGILGAVIGGLVGSVAAGYLLGRLDERGDRAARRGSRLARLMIRAVATASYDENTWAAILHAMRRATSAGAVWPAAAWRLAEAGRHRERQRTKAEAI